LTLAIHRVDLTQFAMKLQTRAFVRTAFVNLMVGALLFAIGLVADAAGFDGRLAVLRYPAIHLLVVGWLTQLIVGVAIWLFPLPERPGSPWMNRLGWIGFGLLNGGLVLRLAGEVGPAFGGAVWAGWALAASATAQAIAAWLFAALLMPRLRPRTGPHASAGAPR
jgi:hypothetical protein